MNSSSFLEWIAALLICCVSLTAIYDPPGASARCAVQYPTASPALFHFVSRPGSAKRGNDPWHDASRL